MDDSPRILIIGAHPDDADYRAAGTAFLWTSLGFRVKFLSLTNGDAGHFQQGGGPLALRRRQEAEAAGRVLGVEYEVWDIHDGELLPTLENRLAVIAAIRRFRPDLVLTHRPYDYHPDHRYTSILVQDASYMVTVPNLCPSVPHLRRNPVFGFLFDGFRQMAPFRPDVVVDVTPVFDRIVEALHCHASQMYEWLPYNGGYQEEVPQEPEERRQWLAQRVRQRLRRIREYCDERVRALYGEWASQVEVVEAFEISEYGSPLTAEARRRLFPFVPWPEEVGG